MTFNSLQFILFFIISTLAYYLLAHRNRWILLLFFSCFFYMVFKPSYILILLITIVVDYWAAIFIAEAEGRNRRLILAVSIICNVGFLAVFKYYNFFAVNISELLTGLSIHGQLPMLDILLPVGLSFHTFQAMSYTIEVYRGNQKVERHFGIYALYVMFYPQLVAGPIERPQNMLHQFYEEHKADIERIKAGLIRMCWGFFKKVVIADRLAVVVNDSYNHVQDHNGVTFLLSTFFFSFQIYCDFSGYSDIALGAASVLGFDLMENFRVPYISKSISEFWSRWHISLSTWFRDYLYIPLGGNRVSKPRWYFNLFFVFLVSGFWHGANWTYIAWGALHGVYLISAHVRDSVLRRSGVEIKANAITDFLNMVFTFLLVMLAWIFFRAATITDAMTILHKMLCPHWSETIKVPFNRVEMAFCLVLICLLMVKEKYMSVIPTGNTWIFALGFLLLSFITYLFGMFNSSQFIYFQF